MKIHNIKEGNNVEYIIKFPPEIPSQLNQYDCGVFMLQFAKFLCLGSDFLLSSEDMNYYRQEIREELIMNQINSTLVSPPSYQQLRTYPFFLYSFQNPPRTNLCFSNAVTSLLLNTPPLKEILTEEYSHSRYHLSCNCHLGLTIPSLKQ